MADPFPTTGSTFTVDRTGIARIENIFVIDGPAEDGGAEPYEVLYDWEPATKPLGLVAMDRKATKRDDGDWDLVIGFEGAKDFKALGTTAEIDFASVDSPIETFERFDEFAKKWSAIFDGEKFDGFKRKIKDPVSGDIIQNPYYGTSRFLETNPVLRIAFGLKDFTAELFKDVGKIAIPIVPEGQSYLRDAPDGMNWLKRTIKGSWRGNVWQFNLDYALGSWGPDIYAARP
jgi:hypothetical protein